MFIYFCQECRKFEAFKSKTGNFKCPACGNEYLPLQVTVDEWNSFSNDQMLDAIELAKKPVIKTPEFEKKVEPVQIIEDDSDLEPIEQVANRYQGHNTPTYMSQKRAKDKTQRSVGWMIVSIISLISPLFTFPFLPFIICAGIALIVLIISIIALIKRAKLRGFAIASIVVSSIIVLITVGAIAVKGLDTSLEEIKSVFQSSEERSIEDIPTKNVTYGRVTFSIPEENWELIQTGDDHGQYGTKDKTSVIGISLTRDFRLANSDFKTKKKDLIDTAESEFPGIIQTVTDSYYVDVDVLTAFVLTFTGKDGNRDTIGRVMIINDPVTSQGLIVDHLFYAKDEGKYGKVFDKIIETAKVRPVQEYSEFENRNTSAYSNSSETEDNRFMGSDNNTTGGVDPQLKAALDDYEAFMDKYVAFMKKYQSDPGNAISMIGEYTEIVAQYAEYVNKIETYEKQKNEMSTEDWKYYLDVTNRVEKKMIDVIQ